MAITKILARKGRLDVGINYVLNGDKTQERVLTALGEQRIFPAWVHEPILATQAEAQAVAVATPIWFSTL